MKQQCHLSMIWLSWAVYLAGLLWFFSRHDWIYAAFWLVGAPIAQWLYIRRFPSLSSAMGYGPVIDEPAALAGPAAARVTLYTALGCPFCPLIEQRLENLRATMGFTLEKVDVTLRPDLLASQRIFSVPAVKVGGKILTGLASTHDLAAAIAESAAHAAA